MKYILSLICAMILPFAANASVDSNLVKKAENYLNSITGLSGEFIQYNGDNSARGDFAMLRPGKIRLDYSSLPIQLISDGTDLYFFDQDLDQITTVPVTSTPAGILVRKNINLQNGDIVVSETNKTDDDFSLKMYMKDNEGAGNMIVYFYNSPVKLKSWTVIDALGNKTDVSFQDLKTKTNFGKDYFQLERHKTVSGSGSDSYYD